MDTDAPSFQKPGLIFSKISAVMADLEAIQKGSKNKTQGYSFRGIDAVYNELHKHLCKHKIFTTTEVIDQRREEKTQRSGSVSMYSILTIRFKFWAEDGSSVESVMVGEGMDSGDKASNKAMSVAHKYAFLQIFAIPTEEDKDPEVDDHDLVATDPNPPVGEEPPPPDDYGNPSATESEPAKDKVNNAQLSRLWAIANECKWTREQVHESLKKGGLNSSSDLNQEQYEKMISFMRKNRKQ